MASNSQYSFKTYHMANRLFVVGLLVFCVAVVSFFFVDVNSTRTLWPFIPAFGVTGLCVGHIVYPTAKRKEIVWDVLLAMVALSGMTAVIYARAATNGVTIINLALCLTLALTHNMSVRPIPTVKSHG